MKTGKIWLNIASSPDVLKDYVNLDNSIFLRHNLLLRVFRFLLPKDYRIHVDKYYNAQKKADLRIHDCRKRLKWQNATVDHILCSHYLEHIYPDEMRCVLKDFYRVLKPGGTLHVIVPDLRGLTEKYLADCKDGRNSAADEFVELSGLSTATRGTLKYRLLEFSGSFGLQHRWMYDFESMSTIIETMGFEPLNKNEVPSQKYRQNDRAVNGGGLDSAHIVSRKSYTRSVCK